MFNWISYFCSLFQRPMNGSQNKSNILACYELVNRKTSISFKTRSKNVLHEGT